MDPQAYIFIPLSRYIRRHPLLPDNSKLSPPPEHRFRLTRGINRRLPSGLAGQHLGGLQQGLQFPQGLPLPKLPPRSKNSRQVHPSTKKARIKPSIRNRIRYRGQVPNRLRAPSHRANRQSDQSSRLGQDEPFKRQVRLHPGERRVVSQRPPSGRRQQVRRLRPDHWHRVLSRVRR